MKISSLQNNKIKNIIKLQQKSRERKKQSLFVVEGIQENTLALENGFKAEQFYVCEEIFNDNLPLPHAEIYTVSNDVFEKIAYRGNSGGIVGVYQIRNTELQELPSNKNLILTVLESVEKPGNLGAILRSCDAAQVDAVVICETAVDFFNPNVIRSSVGTIFTTTIISCDKAELLAFCQANNIEILSTYLNENTVNFYDMNLLGSTALVFGTESTGLSDYWLAHSANTIKIPMMGQVDSLNVSNAVAVCVFEVLRQRRFNTRP